MVAPGRLNLVEARAMGKSVVRASWAPAAVARPSERGDQQRWGMKD